MSEFSSLPPRDAPLDPDTQPFTVTLLAHLVRQIEFSVCTFGPGVRTAGVCDHIRKELAEVEASSGDLDEWIDVLILALDGAWRAAILYDDPKRLPNLLIIRSAAKLAVLRLLRKQRLNEQRQWPDWRTADPDKAIEHDRSAEAAALPDCNEGG
jgi:hypothetical protein